MRRRRMGGAIGNPATKERRDDRIVREQIIREESEGEDKDKDIRRSESEQKDKDTRMPVGEGNKDGGF